MRWQTFKRALIVTIGLCTLAVAAVFIVRSLTARQGPIDVDDALFPEWREFLADALHVGGPADAEYILIEFMDFQCPFSRRLANGPAAIAAASGIRIVMLHFPLGYYPFAVPAAISAECADRQGKVGAMYEALFAASDSFGIKEWREYAREAGVPDLDAFEECRQLPETDFPRIERGRAIGRAIGVRGTPTVLVNGLRLARPPQAAEQIMEAARP